jgi:hypothetical protein
MRKTIDHLEPAGGLTRNSVARAKLGISFGPAEVVAAISFHLLDEGIATAVCPEAARRTVARLSAKPGPVVEISRSFWGEMNNPERLAWLLASADTTYDLARNGLAVLDVRRK